MKTQSLKKAARLVGMLVFFWSGVGLFGCSSGSPGAQTEDDRGVGGAGGAAFFAPEPTRSAALDADGDGSTADVDCDDTDADVHPKASEVCDGKDNDCNGLVDDDPLDTAPYYRDADGDGSGDPELRVFACRRPDGFTNDDGDCDDSDPESAKNCDGGRNPVLNDSFVIYVDKKLGDNQADGSEAAPVRDIRIGLQKARNCGKERCLVRVAPGVYVQDTEALSLVPGVDLECQKEQPTDRCSIEAFGQFPAVLADGIDRKTMVVSFDVVGIDATNPSQGTVAFVVSQSDGLTLLDVRVHAGAGMGGLDGEDGVDASEYCHNGGAGGAYAANQHGKTGEGPSGGSGGTRAGDTSDGRRARTCSTVESGWGKRGADGKAANGGIGRTDPGRAPNGADHFPNSDQAGLLDPVTGVWLVPSHDLEPAPSGVAGSGGGGGGSGRSHDTRAKCKDGWGGAGGRGGHGGCGGTGAFDGAHGGSSIGLAVVSSTLRLQLVTVHLGAGGAGGRGGTGGSGKNGEHGTLGGKGEWEDSGSKTENGGGHGGHGGHGGRGGHGAGGNGGPSIGIFVQNGTLDEIAPTTFTQDVEAASGGKSAGNAGNEGLVTSVYDLSL